jgi:large subunit ribosomal protein L18
MLVTKESRRAKIHTRIRSKIKGTAERPRLSVFRSNTAIYVQLIDDLKGVTIAAASSKDKDFSTKGTKTEQSKAVGQAIAAKAAAAGITTVVFDRSGYLYHGRIQALAEGAREGGLKF